MNKFGNMKFNKFHYVQINTSDDNNNKTNEQNYYQSNESIINDEVVDQNYNQEEFSTLRNKYRLGFIFVFLIIMYFTCVFFVNSNIHITYFNKNTIKSDHSSSRNTIFILNGEYAVSHVNSNDTYSVQCIGYTNDAQDEYNNECTYEPLFIFENLYNATNYGNTACANGTMLYGYYDDMTGLCYDVPLLQKSNNDQIVIDDSTKYIINQIWWMMIFIAFCLCCCCHHHNDNGNGHNGHTHC